VVQLLHLRRDPRQRGGARPGDLPSVADRHGGLLTTLNDIFLGVFVVELAIRLVGFGSRPQDFFRSGWNVFDFLVVAASFTPGLRENAMLLRIARLARVLRIVRLLPDLRVLVVAIGRSIPGVLSLAVLALLVLFVYGMIGWTIFDDHAPEQYGTIGEAMLTLFVTLTLENLPEQIALGRDLSEWTLLYFISYALIAAFLIFNILIGVVINSLEEARAIEHARERADRLEHGGDAGPTSRIACTRSASRSTRSRPTCATAHPERRSGCHRGFALGGDPGQFLLALDVVGILGHAERRRLLGIVGHPGRDRLIEVAH
jgi:voltage-gated sodium channel